MARLITLKDLTFAFTRPADTTAYAAGDQVANNTVAGSVTPVTFAVPEFKGSGGIIRAAQLVKSTTTITNADFRLILLNAQLAAQFGDNAAATPTYAGIQTALGSIDFSNTGGLVQFSNGVLYNGSLRTQPAMPGLGIACLPTDVLHGLLIATAAYAPGNAEQFQIRLVPEVM